MSVLLWNSCKLREILLFRYSHNRWNWK